MLGMLLAVAAPFATTGPAQAQSAGTILVDVPDVTVDVPQVRQKDGHIFHVPSGADPISLRVSVGALNPYDPEDWGDYGGYRFGSIDYSWVKVSGGPVTWATVNAHERIIFRPIPGTYQFRVDVQATERGSGAIYTGSDTMTLTVNGPAPCMIIAPAEAQWYDTINLDAGCSTYSDLSVLKYHWPFVSYLEYSSFDGAAIIAYIEPNIGGTTGSRDVDISVIVRDNIVRPDNRFGTLSITLGRGDAATGYLTVHPAPLAKPAFIPSSYGKHYEPPIAFLREPVILDGSASDNPYTQPLTYKLDQSGHNCGDYQ